MRWISSRSGFAGALLLAGLGLWAVTAWPLPRFFARAIPCTNINTGMQTVSPLVPGDHLQLLYHFWLGLDTLSGHSPVFHNVYEFNLGDDSVRRQPDLYYLPFSLVYAAVAPAAGNAAGWNAAGLASALLGLLALGLLARRFADSAAAALVAALVAAVFPYRWITLFTGSPTGFAMAFPPLLAYGLDRAIRDRSPLGGLWAGLALLFSYTTDLHVFYFSMLAAPFFALLSFWRAAPDFRRWPTAARARIVPLLPFVLLMAAAAAIGVWMTSHLSASVMGSGRHLSEMASYSPPASGLVATVNAGMANHAYFGVPLFALLAVALLLPALPIFRRAPGPGGAGPGERIAVLALAAAIAVVILLALGIHVPFEGLAVRIVRKVVPKYSMIRQTVKIYCLLPTLLAALLALRCDRIFRPGLRTPTARLAAAAVLGLVLWTVVQALEQTTPGFCRLPRANAAYEAVAGDDKANAGRPAHALALPLWPGASHWTSLCEYNITLSRVRLVNGYAPAVPAGYFERVFQQYESLNQGVATDEQLDGLLGLGVRHLLFHANAFPEQVSPFPSAAALRNLTGHPRLALIAEDGLTFAFRILPKNPVEHTPHANWTDTLYAAARQWKWDPPLEIATGKTAPLYLRAPVFPAPELRFLLRPAGSSAQPLLLPRGKDGTASLTHPVPGLPDWLESELPDPLGAQILAQTGPVALSHALLTAGDLPAPSPDGAIHIPPALLFHVGHSLPGQPAVAFDPETVPAGLALYGPNLPFPPGVYDITLAYTMAAGAAGGPPGIFRVLALPDNRVIAEADLDPAADALRLSALAIGADPIRFEFHYLPPGAGIVLHDIRLAPATLRLQPAAP